MLRRWKDQLALHGHVEQMEGRSATEEDLQRVHTAALGNRVREAVAQAAAQDQVVSLDADTRVSGASWDAALGSAGYAISAAEQVASGELRSAFVATRPPGHHATPDQAMGFCLFNSVAIAARALQAAKLAERVLIVDWDVHHGNGTQDIFYEDGSVFFCSLHQSPHWPGAVRRTNGAPGQARGTTLNVPLAARTPAAAQLDAFERGTRRDRSGLRARYCAGLGGLRLHEGRPAGRTRTGASGPPCHDPYARRARPELV